MSYILWVLANAKCHILTILVSYRIGSLSSNYPMLHLFIPPQNDFMCILSMRKLNQNVSQIHVLQAAGSRQPGFLASEGQEVHLWIQKLLIPSIPSFFPPPPRHVWHLCPEPLLSALQCGRRWNTPVKRMHFLLWVHASHKRPAVMNWRYEKCLMFYLSC